MNAWTAIAIATGVVFVMMQVLWWWQLRTGKAVQAGKLIVQH